MAGSVRVHNENRRRRAKAEQGRESLSVPNRPPAVRTIADIRRLQGTAGNRVVTRLMTDGFVVQSKLRVGPAGDAYEREADRIADAVMRGATQATPAVPASDDVHRVRRSVEPGAEPVGLEGGDLGTDSERAIHQAQRSGRRLTPDVRQSMEGAFGTSFDNVRVHASPAADSLSRSMQARAFTVGRDIFFAKGQYSPDTGSGRKLLAHELTHTLQQGASSEPQRCTTVQRALGLEFQTGWGIVRSLPAAVPQTQGAQRPDPNVQSDWPDMPVTHAMDQTGAPSPTAGKKTKKKNLPKVSTNIPWIDDEHQEVSSGMYMLGKEWPSPVGVGAKIAWPTQGRHHYKLFKGQNVKAWPGHFMSVDDADTPLGAELEWVVDPPLSDRKKLGKVLNDLKKHAEQLLKFKSRESFLLSEATKSKADSTIELQPSVKGKIDMEAAPQATGGVSIDYLHRLFGDLANKGQVAQKRQTGKKAKRVQQGKAGKTAPQYLMGYGSTSTPMAMVDAANRIEGSDRLKGLISYIARYAVMGDTPTPMLYAKANTIFLAKTDLGALFRKLPDDELDLYEGDGAAFEKLVATALADKWDASRRIFVSGIQNPQDEDNPVELKLKLGEWVNAIAEHGVDLLSSSYHKQVLATSTDQPALATSALYKTQLESMGGLGSKMDALEGEQAGEETGFVMEFRANTDPSLKPKDWPDYGLTIFDYLEALNRGKA
ncbi:MAG: DUF4157 domain-containing protein [Acidimicrobiales bacterium]